MRKHRPVALCAHSVVKARAGRIRPVNFLKYSLLRLLISALAFFLAYYFGAGFILSVICGALIGFAISYLAFPHLHTAAAADFNRLVRRKSGTKTPKTAEDEAIEDAYDESARRTHNS